MSFLDNENRREVRYWLYRAKKKEVDGVSLGDDAPAGFRGEVEDLDGFTGWENFAEGAPLGWDISEEPPWTIARRKFSVDQEWSAELAPNLRPLPEEEANGSEGDG